MSNEHQKTCPNCNDECYRDAVDVGVGTIYGPWGCTCGWSEDARCDQITGSGGWQENGSYVDTAGNLYPKDNVVTQMMRAAEAHETQGASELDAVAILAKED